ncbi:MAG: hypothetical protein RMA76_22825 [Deltaproteobacteria bacterium]
MKTHRSNPWRAQLAVSLFLFASCVVVACSSGDDGEPTNVCTSDAECTAPGTRCDVARSVCICVTDEACDEDEFCNNAGVCQVEAGCTSSTECTEPNTYCDISSGQCLQGQGIQPQEACRLASHCPFGYVCDVPEATTALMTPVGTCVEGCFDDGDCSLGEVCFEGQCATGLCSADAFCDYGQRCRNASCVDDNRGPYCRSCSVRTAMNPNPCDDYRNFCLINNRELGGFTNFCGVDCSLGQECPNGFQCGGVVILTQQQCQSEADCRCRRENIRFATQTCTVAATCDPRLPDGRPDPDATRCLVAGAADCNGGVPGGDGICIVPKGQRGGNCTCVTNDDCGEDGVCVGGLCCGGNVEPEGPVCAGGEGTIAGFCTCGTDDDCPRDNCDGSTNRCAITGLPCTPGNDDCGPIPCVNGGCLIGRNCAPLQGLTCSEVLDR